MGIRTHGKTTIEVLAEIFAVHDDKFNYDKFVYVNCNTKVTLGCKIHGYFEKYPNDIKRKTAGCPRCKNSWRKTHEEFLKELPKHIFPKEKYKNAKSKINFTCRKHNEDFLATPNSVLLGHINCPECVTEKIIKSKLSQSKSITDPNRKSDFDLYKRAVWRYSNRTYKKHMAEEKRDRQNHLDHIVSILDGFNNKIPPKIMGSIHNIRIISGTSNRKKSYKSDQTTDELIRKYNEF